MLALLSAYGAAAGRGEGWPAAGPGTGDTSCRGEEPLSSLSYVAISVPLLRRPSRGSPPGATSCAAESMYMRGGFSSPLPLLLARDSCGPPPLLLALRSCVAGACRAES